MIFTVLLNSSNPLITSRAARTAASTVVKQLITPSGVQVVFKHPYTVSVLSTKRLYSLKSCSMTAFSSSCFIPVESTISIARNARSRPISSSFFFVSMNSRSNSSRSFFFAVFNCSSFSFNGVRTTALSDKCICCFHVSTLCLNL